MNTAKSHDKWKFFWNDTEIDEGTYISMVKEHEKWAKEEYERQFKRDEAARSEMKKKKKK